MSTATIERLDRGAIDQLMAQAIAARDAGMAQAEEAASEWDIRLLDQAIAWFAQTGLPFSANDIRPLLPADFNGRGLMGARFSAAYSRREIRPITDRPSNKPNTHNKRIAIWVAAGPEQEEA